MWSVICGVFKYIMAIFAFLLFVGLVLSAVCSIIPVVIDSIAEAKEAIKELKGDGK